MALSLTLKPGTHWPGAPSLPIPTDLPPGNIALHLPLYPGATITTEAETQPSISYPAVRYIKSASSLHHTTASLETVKAWYAAALTACGYAPSGSSVSGQHGVTVSEAIEYSRKLGTAHLSVQVSLAHASVGGTLVLSVAIAITPPAYPVPGSVLRVPSSPASLTITTYAGMNPGPRALRPLRTVKVTDAATVRSIATAINTLPKPIGRVMSCPADDGSHLTLVFTDTDRSTHPVRVDLRGCRSVVAPPAPGAIVPPTLLKGLTALVTGPRSIAEPMPFEARTLRLRSARPLGNAPGRFLSSGQSGRHLLYLSRGDLHLKPATGGTGRLLAHGVADAALDTNDNHAVIRLTGHTLQSLTRIDLKTGVRSRFSLPSGAELLGRSIGTGPVGLSDALACYLGNVWYRRGVFVGGIDPNHPTMPSAPSFTTAPFLPAETPTHDLAISCSGELIAVVNPNSGIQIRDVGNNEDGGGGITRRIAAQHVTFLSWAPDDIHIAYRTGNTLVVANVQTGATTRIATLGTRTIHSAAWDPFSLVLALAVTARGSPPSKARILLIDRTGGPVRTLPLPFTGANGVDWSVWKGTALGITRATSHGPQPWLATLPGIPRDVGMFAE
jgi:hypothetical protein